eukprot:502266_1
MKDEKDEKSNHTNCYLRHFITHKDISLKHKLRVIDRSTPFSSLVDVIHHFQAKTNNNIRIVRSSVVNRDNENQNKMTLIRVTTHDHFHQKSDISKHFKVKNRFLEYEVEINASPLNKVSAQVSHTDEKPPKTKQSWKEI